MRKGKVNQTRAKDKRLRPQTRRLNDNAPTMRPPAGFAKRPGNAIAKGRVRLRLPDMPDTGPSVRQSLFDLGKDVRKIIFQKSCKTFGRFRNSPYFCIAFENNTGA